MEVVGSKVSRLFKQPGFLLGVAATLYALSYAPYLRWYHGPDPTVQRRQGPWYPMVSYSYPPSHFTESHLLYQPLELMIDKSPLRFAHFAWCDVWRVRRRAERDSIDRGIVFPKTWKEASSRRTHRRSP